ncbi:signal peptidase I [Brevibacterium otitidis]|uniref:Signal peptidase I n=1 Tax=Brevibacterium otitidis TaxID=53364 RepID=A0ABV5X5X5_9MICO|nr:hypothetical protein GCM10023233_20730 [Brevibacterium otitidis]
MAPKETAEKKSWRSFFTEIAVILVIALVVSTAVKTWVVRSFYIPSSSMEPTLLIDDRVLANQLPGNRVDRGDIVVFTDPGGWLSPDIVASYEPNPVLEFLGLVPADAGSQLVKRAIGVGGDHVECCDAEGRVSVNGEPLDESYLGEGTEPSEIEFSVDVPAGHYWMMGDNRSNSLDSRYNMDAPGGAFVPEDKVVGTVFVRNWPFDRIGRVQNPEAVFADVPQP